MAKTMGKKPSRNEQARMLALSKMGKSAYEIGKIMGRSHVTTMKYITSPIYTDPKFEQAVQTIKEKEILDLYALNTLAKARLHELAPKMNPIESIALMDRTFQQRRLIEGKSTENIMSLTKIIQEAHGEAKKQNITVESK